MQETTMEARVDEIAPQLFRIAVWTGKAPITFNQFVIRDAYPALIHTGHAALFDTVRAQVERLLDPRALRYISFSHFEADECGALNHWLTLAPQAEVLCGPIAARTSVTDFALRPPQAIEDQGVVELGTHRLQVLETPHFPHNWDAILLYETHSHTLFGSDVGTHGGQREAVTADDRSEEVVALQQRLGYISPGPHVSMTLARLRQLPIACLATMHGSALRGANIHTLFTALDQACGTTAGP
jgi:flavorubredoxin